MIREWSDGKEALSPQELEIYHKRFDSYMESFKNPFACDPRFSLAVAEIIKQALLRFKFWIDEPFICNGIDKLHKARKERGLAEKEEMTFWSENHYILFATAEYLAGQLWPGELFIPGKDFQDPQEPNGTLIGEQRIARAKPRLLKWLNQRIQLGWSEWNAPGYYTEHAEALYNLVDFCQDEEIWIKANIALDLLIFDVARLSHRGSFGVTGGRAQSKFKVCGWEQSPGDWIEFLFGRRGAFTGDPDTLTMIAAGSSYEIPDVLLEIGADLNENPLIDQSRVSTHFNEATRYAIGASEASGLAAQTAGLNHRIALSHHNGYNQADDDTVFWWGRGAYFNKQVVNSSVRLLEKYGLQDTDPFKRYGDLFGEGMNVGEDLLATVGAIGGVALLGGAGPAGVILGSAAGAFGISYLAGKGTLRPAIVSGRIAASTAALMALGLPGLLLSIPIAGWPFGDDADHADDISLFVEGSTLSRANLYTWRDRGAMLSSAQDFRPFQFNIQSNFCQATLSTEATVWITTPFSGTIGFDPNHVNGPGWWTGYWSSPRVIQFENAAILAFRPNFTQNRLHANASHCWFPRQAFLDFVEGVKPSNVEGDDDGSWAFGRVVHPDGVEGYIGVYSARDADYLDENSDFYKDWFEKEVTDNQNKLKKERDELARKEVEPKEVAKTLEEWHKKIAELKTLTDRWSGTKWTSFFNDKDLYAEGDNIWIIQVGSSDEYGTFQKFKEEVTAARIHIDFGDMQCSYDIPHKGRLELHTDIDDEEANKRGRFRFKGDRIATDYYPRYSSRYVRAGRVEWGQPLWAIQWREFRAAYSLIDPGNPIRVLNADVNEGEAIRVLGLAIRLRTEHEAMEEDSQATATVRVDSRVIVSDQIIARGEVPEHTDHDIEWLLFDEVDGTKPLDIELRHGPSNPSGDDEPHWRARFELWALLNDCRLLPCLVDLSKALNYSTAKVKHLNFEDEHRQSGRIPIVIPDL
jgi:hypothetical protein